MQSDERLTPKEQAFVEQYLIDFNQTKAALRCGCSPKGAGVAGHRLMKRAAVAREIARRLEGKKELAKVDAARVVGELARIAFGEEDGGGPELKPADRLRALDMLAKHLNLYEDKDKGRGQERGVGVVLLPEVLADAGDDGEGEP